MPGAPHGDASVAAEPSRLRRRRRRPVTRHEHEPRRPGDPDVRRHLPVARARAPGARLRPAARASPLDYLQLVGPAVLAALAAVAVMVVDERRWRPVLPRRDRVGRGVRVPRDRGAQGQPAARARRRGRRSSRRPGSSGSPSCPADRAAVLACPAGLGLDLDEQARVDQGVDDDQRRRRSDRRRRPRRGPPATAAAQRESVTNIRVRTTSARPKPASASARLDDARASPGPAPPTSPGCADTPSGPGVGRPGHPARVADDDARL